jgi:predicted HTH domain antitoxin
MHIEIPDTILNAAQLTPAQLKQELALILWQKSAITDSQATFIADMSLPTFYQLVRQRGLLGKQPVTKLKQILPRPKQTVSLNEMDDAIQQVDK